MISRLIAAVLGAAFVVLIERASVESRRRTRHAAAVSWCALLLAIGLAPLAVFAEVTSCRP